MLIRERLLVKPKVEFREVEILDFVEEHYREILQLVTSMGRTVVPYNSIPWGGRYIVWRHDIDFSVNRSFRLAQINAEHSLHATFFINLHSTSYNPFERSQTKLLREIARLGHDIGVHFDWAFYGHLDETEYEEVIAQEARILADLVERSPVAVSFHNPNEHILKMDKKLLGGLVNAYGWKLMQDAKYCSDSNGYWRFDRLADVVADQTVQRLQVLTHPVWWLEKPMPPRQRIRRAALGRAECAALADYDRALRDAGRQNFG